MNMLTKSRVCDYSLPREAAMPRGGVCIVGRRCTPGQRDPTYLQEGQGHVILLQEVSIRGGPLHNQADDPPLIVEGIVHLLLFCTL